MTIFDKTRKAASPKPPRKRPAPKLPPKTTWLLDGRVKTTRRFMVAGKWKSVTYDDEGLAMLRKVYEMANFRDPEYAYRRLAEIRKAIEDSMLLRSKS